MSEQHVSQIVEAEIAKVYALAGRAKLTVVSEKTGARFTYKLTEKTPYKEEPYFRVDLLTGSDNQSDYTPLGELHKIGDAWDFQHRKRSRLQPKAPGAIAFRYFWWCVEQNKAIPEKLRVFSSGVCARCSRELTREVSIRVGLGPDCADHLGVGHMFEWEARLLDGRTFTCHGGSESTAREDLRSQLGCKRLPKGTVILPSN